MTSEGELALLAAAVDLGFLARTDFEEIEAERDEAERFLGRPVPISHLLYQRRWLTSDQLDQVRATVRRRILLCPSCWSRINCFGIAGGRAFACTTCKTALVVPEAAEAEVLLRRGAGSPAAAPRTVDGTPTAVDQETRRLERDRGTFALRGFEILERRAAGGQGIVYRALQHPLERPVAIKVLHADLGSDSRAVRRFFRESRAAARVEHPNVLPIFHAGFSEGAYFLVFPWVNGCTLEGALESRGTLPVAVCLRYGLDLARGLAAIHAAGMVHRDVKPSNVLVRDDDSACLTDFGLVRQAAPDASGPLTKTGEILGTIGYMAPEQLRDPRQATPASDVFSLGATLYHLLAGRGPFEDEEFCIAALRLSRGEIPRLDAEALGLPPVVVDLVGRMMEPDPKRRFATMAAAAQEMHAVQRDAHAPTPGRGGRRRDHDTRLPRELDE